MGIPDIKRLKRIVRRLDHRFYQRGLILLYHRVAEVGSDPWGLCVSPRHFAEHMEVLRKHGSIIPLRQMRKDLADGNLPRKAVAVTFDDGYVDNLQNAKPLLARYDIPATVFVTTGYLGRDCEFWWDELERLLLQPGTLPEKLHLSVNGSTYQWEIGEAIYYSEETYQRLRCWHIEQQNDPTPRHYLYRTLWQLLYPLRDGERRKVLDDLLAWGDAKRTGRSTQRVLSPEEVVDLAEGGLVEVGAHTVTHASLPTLPLALQEREIQESKNCLEEIIGRPVRSLAYPHGDYTAETVSIVRETGFTCACSADAGIIWESTNHFQLPRVQVLDWDGEQFARQLSTSFRSD